MKAYPLGDDDIRRILGDIKIHNYPDLNNMRSADELFDSKGRCILLFPNSSPRSGHWTCLMNRKDHIYFWDSYGDAPEEQKDGVPRPALEKWEMDTPELLRLLKGSGKPVYYNTHQYQRDSPTVATCGRWCVARLLYAPKSERYFANVIKKSGMTGDDFVSALTANWLKK